MLNFFRRYYHLFLFIPGLIILGVGMLTLHTSIKLSSEQNLLRQHYQMILTQHPGFSDSAAGRKIKILTKGVQTQEKNLYWSVIAIALTGFLLLIINADHLRKLVEANKERQKSLKLLEHRLAAIEASFEGIAIVDPQGLLTYMNKALADIYGVAEEQKEDYIGHFWLKLYSDENQAYIKNHVLPQFEREGFWHDTSKLLRRDGRAITAELSMTRLSDGGFIGTARDVTEIEKASAEKKEIQNQLAQAQKMEAIGRLAGGIAHDFNNILAAINGYAEFLTEDLDEDSPQKKYADNILKAGYQARALIDQILAFSRRQDGDVENIDLCGPLNESISMLKATLPKKIAVHTDIQVMPAPIEGNATQIAQAIMNLCVNARDAMRDDEGVLSISLKTVDVMNDIPMTSVSDDLPAMEDTPLISIEEGEQGQTYLHFGTVSRNHQYIKLSVSDTGTGMSRMIMEHIFEPFFTTKDVHKGTGLGLASVHGTMTSHRGALFIESVLGKGTKFDLLFPLSKVDEQSETDIDMHELETHGGLVLLVEDQDEVREMTSTMLKRLGYDVETARNGLEASDMLCEKPGEYDLVLTDQNMPKMTGTELIRQSSFDFPELPFVILTGYSEEKLLEFMQEQPALKDVLRKPVSQKILAKTLSEVLKGTANSPTKKAAAI
ncbi:MAG: response regulator [Rhodospirillales bacterium]|nr:response regulator [Alphaproteobacteria bacterium]USO06614.1 MAG: response regulator [Rhodospirillales bacterium]